MAKVAAAAAPILDFDVWFAALTKPTALIELATLAGCLLLAWCLFL